MKDETPASILAPTDLFVGRHIGPSQAEIEGMLATLGVATLDALSDEIIPSDIRLGRALDLPKGQGEHEFLAALRATAKKNQVLRSFLGMGYHDCVVPPVILRNVLENPGWYTQYTPYQAEISQGRLEALLVFQTMVSELTGLPLANASLLDEGTAAAEAVSLCLGVVGESRHRVFVASDCHPQTKAVVATRARALALEVVEGDPQTFDFSTPGLCCAVLQYPGTDGRILDLEPVIERVHQGGALAAVACDLLALCLLRSPGSFGADVAFGSAQRFGVPMGFGGPHAAFFSTRSDFRRHLPGRVIGVSKDSAGNLAYRMAMQTREQHIRRDKATSNICTAQVLLAIMSAMYAVYHGPKGLEQIARRVHGATCLLARGLQKVGCRVGEASFFDTLRVEVGADQADAVLAAALERGVNLRKLGPSTVGVALDETVTEADLVAILSSFAGKPVALDPASLSGAALSIPGPHARTEPLLTHPTFHRYHAEHELLRYLHRLSAKDLSLTTSMIPLGSCTMKLNATSEMIPVTWPEFGALHPFVPNSQAEGYAELLTTLGRWLCEITGFHAASLQPNAGSQGEYAGLLVMAAYHEGRGDAKRNVCLIPVSAHGTNPASAVMAGMKIVVVNCDDGGNIDVEDLRQKADKHRDVLCGLMVTYPSTHGVFEERIREICDLVHAAGGLVYLDGANMNAQVGLCRPGDYGADVCHLNLHKTFCIPHGGGGPGMGPICVAKHLAPYLPGHPVRAVGGEKAIGPVAAAPYGSASILPISYVYIGLMGAEGLRRASQVAMLNANYMAKRLEAHFPVLYRGARGRVAHEFILDLRPFKASAGIEAEDVAKRLMDYGFHAPTMSFPVAGTLMIEPTESETRGELDRLCDALIAIRGEIAAVEAGRWPRDQNPLKHAPHTAKAVTQAAWDRPYSREEGAFPAPWVKEHKYWPTVGRIDNAYGDRHLVCTCPPLEDYVEA